MKNIPLWLLLSRIARIINNLVPIFGVIFLKWNLFNLILIFWLESGVIGVFYLIKLLKDKGPSGLKECMIFTVAIGAFMFGHYTCGKCIKQPVVHILKKSVRGLYG